MLPSIARRARATFTALLLGLATLLVAGGLMAPSALAAPFSVAVPTAQPTGTKDAGAFSDFALTANFPGDSTPKSLAINLPTGQLGALSSIATCPIAQFNADACATATKIGSTAVVANSSLLGIDINASGDVVLIPTTGTEIGRIGIIVRPSIGEKMFIQGTLRTRDDYGIVAAVPTLPNEATLSILGFPTPTPITLKSMQMTMFGRAGGTGTAGFFFNPSNCATATTRIDAVGYDNTTSSASASYTPVNCGSAPFTPTVRFTPNSTAAATPTAFTVDVGHPYDATAAKVGAPFKSTTIVLPAGVQLTGASNSDGQLVACTDAEFKYGTSAPASCPAGSKVGSVVFDSPLVGDVLGDVFLAQPAPGSGDLIRLFVVAQRGPQADALRVKLLTRVSVDPATGLLTNTLTDLPEQPVRSFRFTFRAGSAPGVRQPRLCGNYPGSASLISYATTTPVNLGSTYVVDQGCATSGRFRPTIGMTTSPTTAGAATTGTTTIDLPIGDEALTSVTASLPPGLLANIKSVPRCTIAQVQADACTGAAQVGSVRSLAGQSTVPGGFDGAVYLTDAPAASSNAIAGLYIRVPVVVGPIVVDTLKIQGTIRLRPDYGIDVVSAIPDTVRGLQLDQQKLTLTFNRANFMVNPPVCSGNTISGAFGSAQSSNRTISSPMTVTGCDQMVFDPSVSFSTSTSSARAAASLTTTVTIPASAPSAIQSPVKRVAVTLPEGVSLSASAGAGGDLVGCSVAEFAPSTFADPTCPAGSNVGTTTIETPTVGRLTGNAYLAETAPGHLARVFVDAKSVDFGAAARVKIEGVIDVDPQTGRTTATFGGLPPVAFTSFALTMRGGSKPVLAMPRTCGTFAGSAVATPYSGATKTPSGSLTISQDCPASPAAFSPSVSLSRSNTTAGLPVEFTQTIDLPDGQEEFSSLDLSLPAGLLGAIATIPTCKLPDDRAPECPNGSLVGTVKADVGVASAPYRTEGKVYLTQGTDEDIAHLGIVVPAKVGPIDLGLIVVTAHLDLRSDYGLDVHVDEIPTRVKGVRLDLRRLELKIDRPGFMVNPVACGDAPATATLRGAQGATQIRQQTLTTDGCDGLALGASLAYDAAPAVPSAASEFTTSVRAAAPPGKPLDAMRSVIVRMPDGVSLSPSAGARGDLDECTAEQFTEADITVDNACPAGSKIGTVHLVSPLVGDLDGEVFLGRKRGDHFSSVYFQVNSAEYAALRVKIAGDLDVDPSNGRLTATFDDLPQVQVAAIDLKLRGGSAPVLAMPRTCGAFVGMVEVIRYNGETVDDDGMLRIGDDCPDPAAFSPSLAIGLSNTQAGADTALTTTVTVPPRQGELSSLGVTMPRGLLGRLTVVPPCPIATAQAGACGPESLVGTVTAKVGVSTAPYTVTGKAYMTAGTDDAIAGLAFVLPAKVGPIDLGNVITLAKLKIEGNDLQLKIVADSIPTRVQGIPLNIGELTVAIDKPGVVLNATTCDARNADATFGSVQGGTAGAPSAYAATGCDKLAWKPKMDLMFTGTASELAAKGHPTVRTVIEQTEGQGNLAIADVLLPTAVSTDLTNINANLCESAAAASAGACPDKSKAGTAEIITSALPAPVDAAIHIVRIPGQPLPGLAIRVRDQISFDVVGITSIDKSGRIHVVFSGLPDTPISKMTLVFAGGPKGLIQLNRDVCADSGTTNIALTSQHGAKQALELATNCNGKIANPLNTRAVAGGSSSLVTLRPSGKKRGYSVVVKNPSGVRRVTFAMPKGYTYAKAKTARANIKVTTTGAGKAKVKVTRRLSGQTLTVSVGSGKVTRVAITAKPKAGRFSASLTKQLRAKSVRTTVKPTLTILDATAKQLTPLSTLKVAAK
ncbi:MAG: hypothetical protein Q7T55_19590 [Solirubrobacteraceae bacterium]|nr:hypothetical protein [Solirubrobacteraceae bacterium]